jgi:hypothetical protein
MPSPFPGMDPYLEGPKWMSFHSALTVEIARQLSQHLPPRYVALPNERMVVTVAESDDVSITRGSIFPDTSIVDLGAGEADAAETSGPMAAVAAPVLMVATLMPESIPHLTVEIRDSANEELVTAIEVLSPTNKGSDGREEYLAKRRRILLRSGRSPRPARSGSLTRCRRCRSPCWRGMPTCRWTFSKRSQASMTRSIMPG